MLKVAYILRGLPGSGKSTLAHMLKREFELSQIAPAQHAIVISSDDFFMKDGVYKFDPSMLAENHNKSYEIFLKKLEDMFCGRIILDNTNTQLWEYQRYWDAAKAAGWRAQTIIVGRPKDPAHVQECFERGTHNVPLDKIQAMSARFQL